jgi:predicted DCC family thiol-disulfide oxidoreductase YuxK
LPETAPILLYDGVCALCNWTVKLVLRFDRGGPMRFAPLDSPIARSLLADHPDLANIDSIVLVSGPRASVRSTAVLEIARYLGGFWKVFLVGYLIPREIRDSLYDVMAYWRYRIFGKYAACPVPSPETNGRFLFD